MTQHCGIIIVIVKIWVIPSKVQVMQEVINKGLIYNFGKILFLDIYSDSDSDWEKLQTFQFKIPFSSISYTAILYNSGWS